MISFYFLYYYLSLFVYGRCYPPNFYMGVFLYMYGSRCMEWVSVFFVPGTYPILCMGAVTVLTSALLKMWGVTYFAFCVWATPYEVDDNFLSPPLLSSIFCVWAMLYTLFRVW